jgi:hypothetical protein
MATTYPRLDIRADQEILDRVDRLAAVLSRPGAEITRSSAARAALLRGLDAIEAETSESAKQRSLASKPVKKKTAKK